MKVDLTGVPLTFPVVPEGVYDLALVEWEETAAKPSVNRKTGKPNPPSTNLAATFEIVGDADEELVGKKLWMRWNIRPNDPTSLMYLKRDLVRMGIDAEDLEGEFDTDELLATVKNGSTVKGKVGIYTYEGTERNSLDIVDPNAAEAVTAGGW